MFVSVTSDPATEHFVVIVIDRIWETETPHGIPGRRIHQPAMAGHLMYLLDRVVRGLGCVL